MGIVVEVLCELENFHMSREELEVTRLGKHINQLRKNTTDKSLAGRAKNLIKKWRDLLGGDGNSGPGPGGGNNHNNNNSSLATNGNSGSRLDNAVANSSPRLPPSGHAPSQRGSAQSRAAPPSHLANSHRDNRQSPASKSHPPVSKPPPPHISKSRTPVSSPRVTPSSVSSPRVPPSRDSRGPSPREPPPSLHKSQSARNSVPQSHHVRNTHAQKHPVSPTKPPQIKALSNGSRSRDSPEVVCLDSGSSSPASILSVHSSSRPNSPDASSISIIKSRDVSPIPRSRTTSPAVIATNKRQRPREEAEDSNGREAKQPRLELHNGSSVSSSPNHLKQDQPRGKVKTPSRPKQPRQRQPPVVNSGYDLTRQMMQASAAKGKVRTTQELVSSLGIESRIPQPPASVTDLVPDMEAKSELMDRFFSSQRPAAEDNMSEAGVSEPPSRPSTAVEISSSEVSSAPASRVATPAVIQPRESIEDILAQLPPIDAAAVLAEVETEVTEEEPEVDGLIPAFKPEVEVTEDMVVGLNNGHLEHIGGITDHSGEFREWHEMAALESKDGELLHILPYSVID